MPAKWEPVICSWWSCNWVLLHFNPIKSRTHCDAVARERRAVGRLHLSLVQVGHHCQEGYNPLKLRRQVQNIIQVSLRWDIRFDRSHKICLFNQPNDHLKTPGVFFSQHFDWENIIWYFLQLWHFNLSTWPEKLYIQFYANRPVGSIFNFHLSHVNIRRTFQ